MILITYSPIETDSINVLKKITYYAKNGT